MHFHCDGADDEEVSREAVPVPEKNVLFLDLFLVWFLFLFLFLLLFLFLFW